MLAIASLYEQTEALGRPINEGYYNKSVSKLSESETIAVKHYNQALYELQKGLVSKTCSPTIVLTACILFTCIEA